MTPAAAYFGAEEWNPFSIPGCVSDFDSRYNLSTLGTDVTNWSARNGLSYFFGPSGTNPQRNAGGWVAAAAGRVYPSILFDGSLDEMICINSIGGLTLPQRLIGGTDQPGTVILVFQLSSFAASAQLFTFSVIGGPTGGPRFGFAAVSGADVWRSGKTDDGLAQVLLSSAVAPTTAKHVLVVTSTGVSTVAYLNGAQIISGAQDVGAMTVNRVELGANAGTTNAPMQVVRQLFYSGAFSPAQAAAASKGLGGMYL